MGLVLWWINTHYYYVVADVLKSFRRFKATAKPAYLIGKTDLLDSTDVFS